MTSVEAQAMAEPLAPAWGWRGPDTGRAAHIEPASEFQATTSQVCGLYPFTAGSGTPTVGTPVGRHQLWGEVVCLDPLAWLRAGLVTNPGMFVLGQPGTGKSTLVKRLVTGAVATGTTPIVLGDTKPDYSRLVDYLGGQVIRVGRGVDRINPLDAGPLDEARRRLAGADAEALWWEVRSRRLSLLLALATLVREARITNAEEVVLGRAIDLLDDRLDRDPTIVDVLHILEQGPNELRSATRTNTSDSYHAQTRDLVFTLDLLISGSLAGVFDAATTRPLDLDAPAISVDISRVRAAGDKLLTAAMLCTWAYAFGMVDAATALADLHAAPRRSYLGVMDELWRALRGAPGLVEHADALTRLNRAKGMASIMITHSLADLDALATEEDRAKAKGFADRSAITVLAGLPPRELARVHEITPLTGPEQQLVTSWSAPDSWQPGARHPGRGKYLIKTGERLGIPVELSLVGPEADLYDTDQAIRATA
jgi:GTPase SAR1 family protein